MFSGKFQASRPRGPVGADYPSESKSAARNRKRKEKKKKEAAEASGQGGETEKVEGKGEGMEKEEEEKKAAPVVVIEEGPIGEAQKKVRNLQKKKKQIDVLKEKRESGITLSAEQVTKIETGPEIEASLQAAISALEALRTAA